MPAAPRPHRLQHAHYHSLRLQHRFVTDRNHHSTILVVANEQPRLNLGQHRIPIEKMLPYETDIRIPLFIKGPELSRVPRFNRS